MNDQSVARDVPSPLMRQTLLDPELLRPVDRPDRPVRRLLPRLTVVTIGGSSVIDKGADVLLPVVDELRAALADNQLLILTGAGVRARHVLGVGLDLGLPTGALAGLIATEAEQNGHLIAALLAEHGVSYLPHGGTARQLAIHLAASNAVVSNAYPPYGLFEFPAAVGRIPAHRSDAGAVLLADAYGAARVVFVKGAAEVGRITAAAALALAPDQRPVDEQALKLMATAKHVREIQVVGADRRGALADAIAGKHSGTIITA